MAHLKKEAIPLSRERVCAEALALVDESGLDSLTMRRLASRLGCEAMSLYRHVRDKADLLDAVQAAMLGTLEPELDLEENQRPRAPGWRRLLGGLARALRSTLLRHPNVVPLMTVRPIRAPEAVKTIARIEGALLAAGFDNDGVERAVHVVGMFTIGHSLFEQSTRNEEVFRFGLEALLDGVERDLKPKHPRRQS
jgi:AcrR family transcriptional regulator